MVEKPSVPNNESERRITNEMASITETGLLDDIINVWTVVDGFVSIAQISKLNQKLPTYREYVENRWKQCAEEIMEKSSPEQVHAFNKLVERYNALIESGELILEKAAELASQAISLFGEQKSNTEQ